MEVGALFLDESLWAMEPAALARFGLFIARVEPGTADEGTIAEFEAAQRRRLRSASGPLAILPIQGVITKRLDFFSALFGGTSSDMLAAQVTELAADDRVGTIMLDVDSPGGMVRGTIEAAAAIAAAAKIKPVVAHVSQAASAAYWLASQATEIIATTSGEVGSVGIVFQHVDQSAMDEKDGIKVTTITAPKAGFKMEGDNPHEPLDEEAAAELQRRADDYYAQFVGDIAKGRGISRSAVRDDFGQGRMVAAKDALADGMIDKIETLPAAITRLSTGKARVMDQGGTPNGSERAARAARLYEIDAALAGSREG